MIKRITLATAFLFAWSCAQANEFGNVFGKQADRSSQASAQALDGVTSIFIALKERELKNIKLGQENLASASKALHAASVAMKSIEFSASEDITLSEAGVSSQIAERLGSPPPRDLRELYALFLNETARLASLTEELSKNGDTKSIMPLLGPILSNYIRLGDIVTRVSSQIKR